MPRPNDVECFECGQPTSSQIVGGALVRLPEEDTNEEEAYAYLCPACVRMRNHIFGACDLQDGKDLISEQLKGRTESIKQRTHLMKTKAGT